MSVSNGTNYSEPAWFDEPHQEPAAAELVTAELSKFLRSHAARRQLSEDPSAKQAPRVYWHQGSEVDFFERVPHRLPSSRPLTAHMSVFGYEQPQHSGQALAEWTLNGNVIPVLGARFRVFDLKTSKWIGSGRIEEDRDSVFAFLVAGLWSDFYKYEHDCSGLVLVIFDC
ncbi:MULTISPECIES: hypothetical protein [unclassified Lentimonas]|uniref:hypothetical protein n=1 Tax=unclassified Lentimonas TaxID=2630993 RepID=UPI001326005F|nr:MULTISPECIES: hypothetical protein [unclassified Lentimonas]CAA6678323.1 Unannotated [Lentimonas sp. CC4]CAA6685415.1 Unannotated [Lentimonas sp. CC6]CAA6690603.1 Unannotated [Lentimonas sp. CC10]CAA6695268.1 Unannotated [Lentimonas sp. CC19]CAA7068860.1 Unannotated [Lentimonas sp. CC11]